MVEEHEAPKTIFAEFLDAKTLCHAIEETLDATPVDTTEGLSNREKLFAMYEEAREACKILGEKCQALAEEITEEKKVQKGSYVRVMGSSSPKDAAVGLVGKVIWVGTTKFGKERVGIDVIDSETGDRAIVWASLYNVEVDL